MCGIAGIISSKFAFSLDDLRAMAKTLHHRGPDATGYWHSDGVGLAHTRLAVVDTSERGTQPMVSANGRVHLVFNGEIYNHRSLRTWLISKGCQFRSTTDTEILLEGYCLLGKSFLDKIEGMFAFAIWDTQSQQLWMVRDRTGEKPLFYKPLPNGGLIFASEIKAIQAVKNASVEANTGSIPEYLLYGYVPQPNTFYKQVYQLPPGHFLTATTASVPKPTCYWHPPIPTQARKVSYRDAQIELRHQMSKIIRDRLEADVPVGAFLSGGLDSATVVGVATKDLGRQVHTYSIGFEGSELDESSDARLSAQHLGSVHTEFLVTANDVPAMETLVYHHDGPFGDSSAIPTYLVSKLARKHVTVALTGDGGDEVFGGYPRFARSLLIEKLPRSWRKLIGISGTWLKELSTYIPNNFPFPTGSRVVRIQQFTQAIARELPRRILHWNSHFPLSGIPQLVRGSKPTTNELAHASDRWYEQSKAGSELTQMLFHNFGSYLADDLLVKVDRCAMANSLETRSPMLDSSLISMVGNLPDSYKIQGLVTKRILRDTFRDLLHPVLLTRPKRGFGVPLASWLNGPLASALQHDLCSAKSEIYRYLDYNEIQEWFPFRSGLNNVQAVQAFALWTLAIWLKGKSN
jgi:asparagine synthase (glutamine-hydrolysing)